MKYMIMECHPGYAVALDEDGNFLKVANRQYEVGQTVTDVIPMLQPKAKHPGKWLYSLAAMAACLALLIGLFLPRQPYASVYVKINPEVRIDVDKHDHVVGLTGVNQDGIDLIAGYDYHKKSLDLVTDELVDKAVEMGYLTAQGQITISLDSSDQTWIDSHSQSLQTHLQTHMEEIFMIEILVEQYHDDDDDDEDDEDDEDEDDANDDEDDSPIQIPVAKDEDLDDLVEEDDDWDDIHEDEDDNDGADDDDSDDDDDDDDDD